MNTHKIQRRRRRRKKIVCWTDNDIDVNEMGQRITQEEQFKREPETASSYTFAWPFFLFVFQNSTLD